MILLLWPYSLLQLQVGSLKPNLALFLFSELGVNVTQCFAFPSHWPWTSLCRKKYTYVHLDTWFLFTKFIHNKLWQPEEFPPTKEERAGGNTGSWKWVGQTDCSKGSSGFLPSGPGGEEPYGALHLCHFIWKKIAGMVKNTERSGSQVLLSGKTSSRRPFLSAWSQSCFWKYLKSLYCCQSSELPFAFWRPRGGQEGRYHAHSAAAAPPLHPHKPLSDR